MADLTHPPLVRGIKSPNPFWLASAPPTNTAYNVQRAFDAGWGGAVWKTLGETRRSSTSTVRATARSTTHGPRS